MPYIGKSPLTGNYNKLDSITGSFNGSTTAFNLTVGSNALTPVRAETLLVSLNGVIQQAATDYTVSGTQITFTTAPASSDTCFIIAFGEKLDIGTPSDATVTSAKLASSVLTGATDIGAGIADADLFLVDDGAGGTLRKTAASRIKTYISGGSKNLLINGSMTVAQRLTQTSVGAADGDKTACDMWKVLKRGSPEGRVTATQTNDTNMNLNGHEYTCKLDCTTAESAVAATEAHTLSQSIEAQNLQGLKYGTANAEAVTLSFWFSSPKTGIHCASIYLSDTGYSQVKEFTIASANTWEYFSLTFSANTSNKINNDTGSGMIVSFALTAGTNFQVPADAWGAAEDFATSNQQNLLDNTSNSVSLAGVQLEIGSVATDFAHEDIGTTLDLCRRYYQQINSSDSAGTWGVGACYSTTSAGVTQFLPTTMRAAPTISISAASDFQMSTDATTEVSSVSFETGGAISAVPFISGFWVIGSANHTANEAVRLRAKTSNAKVYLTAEL